MNTECWIDIHLLHKHLSHALQKYLCIEFLFEEEVCYLVLPKGSAHLFNGAKSRKHYYFCRFAQVTFSQFLQKSDTVYVVLISLIHADIDHYYMIDGFTQ